MPDRENRLTSWPAGALILALAVIMFIVAPVDLAVAGGGDWLAWTAVCGLGAASAWCAWSAATGRGRRRRDLGEAAFATAFCVAMLLVLLAV